MDILLLQEEAQCEWNGRIIGSWVLYPSDGEKRQRLFFMGNPSDARGQCRIINSSAHKVLLFYWGLIYSEMAPDISGGGGGGRNSAN